MRELGRVVKPGKPVIFPAGADRCPLMIVVQAASPAAIFLQRNGEQHRIGAKPAPFLRHGHTEKAEPPPLP